MGIEYGFGKWLGLDMAGFASQQAQSMDKYDRLLVQLGEKNYIDEESQWSVEVQLLGVVAMNTAMFIFSKKFEINFINIIQSMNTKNNTKPQDSNGKKQMKRPNINLDNFKNLNS